MTNYRKTSTGALVAPRRGQPPAVPDGYERDPGDAYVFLPKLEDCDYRITEIKFSGCCNQVIRTCKVIDYTVSRNECVECKGDTEWIKTKHGEWLASLPQGHPMRKRLNT